MKKFQWKEVNGSVNVILNCIFLASAAILIGFKPRLLSFLIIVGVCVIKLLLNRVDCKKTKKKEDTYE